MTVLAGFLDRSGTRSDAGFGAAARVALAGRLDVGDLDLFEHAGRGLFMGWGAPRPRESLGRSSPVPRPATPSSRHDSPGASWFQTEHTSTLVLGELYDLPGGAATQAAEFAAADWAQRRQRALEAWNGVFAFVHWDAAQRELVLAVDRLAGQPLYLAEFGDVLGFVTRPSLLCAHPQFSGELDRTALYQFFTFQKLLGRRSYYREASFLAGGEYIIVRDGRVSRSSYWEPRYSTEPMGRAEAETALAGALRRSLERRTRGREVRGVFLSGGLDSRAVLAAGLRPECAFTVGSAGEPDVETSAALTAVHGVRHQALEPASDHLVQWLDRSIALGDGMYPVQFGWFLLCLPQIREQCDVVFHGNPPELFFRGTGLPRQQNVFGKTLHLPRLTRLQESSLPSAFARLCKRSLGTRHASELFREDVAAEYATALPESIESLLEEAAAAAPDLYDRFSWSDTRYTSRYSSFITQLVMRAYLIERSALLFDTELIELHYRLPRRLRADSRLWRAAICRLDPALARVPDDNTGFPLDTPQAIVDLDAYRAKLRRRVSDSLRRRSQRHALHSHNWWADYPERLRSDRALQARLDETLHDPRCLDPAIFRRETVDRWRREHLQGERNRMQLLFLLLTFGRWYKDQGTGRSSGQGDA